MSTFHLQVYTSGCAANGPTRTAESDDPIEAIGTGRQYATSGHVVFILRHIPPRRTYLRSGAPAEEVWERLALCAGRNVLLNFRIPLRDNPLAPYLVGPPSRRGSRP